MKIKSFSNFCKRAGAAVIALPMAILGIGVFLLEVTAAASMSTVNSVGSGIGILGFAIFDKALDLVKYAAEGQKLSEIKSPALFMNRRC